MFGASDTVQCIKMLMDTCCSWDFFLATRPGFLWLVGCFCFPPLFKWRRLCYGFFHDNLPDQWYSYLFSYSCNVYRPASFKCSVLCVSCSVTSLRINSTVALWPAELLVGGWEETSSSALPYLWILASCYLL